MEIKLQIGTRTQQLIIPDACVQDILLPNQTTHGPAGEEAVRLALLSPVKAPRLGEIVRPGEKIAIVTSDITRPMPSHIVMPLLLDELYAAGVPAENITLVFALGTHRRHTEEEMKRLAGERAYAEIRCVDSDPEDCVHFGVTAAGTPVNITRTVAEANRRICIGNIEYHYFAGYSGGAKAIMPGVSDRAAIQANHRMMVLEDACAGNIRTNPLRRDLEEAADMCGVDYILNVVLNEHREIIWAAAGNVTAAHRAGCAFLDTLYRKPIKQRADIVVVSQGGAPKDLNLYQTQKALDNAKHAVRDGGVIILMGSCREGLGDRVFEEWLTSAGRPRDLIDRIRRDFQLGGHKAAAIAMVLEHADIYLVSDLAPALVKTLFMTPFGTVQAAYDAAALKLGKRASVLVMPCGGSTLPQTEDHGGPPEQRRVF